MDSPRGTREAGKDSLDSLRGTGRQERIHRAAREAPGRQGRINWTACEAPARHQRQERAIWTACEAFGRLVAQDCRSNTDRLVAQNYLACGGFASATPSFPPSFFPMVLFSPWGPLESPVEIPRVRGPRGTLCPPGLLRAGHRTRDLGLLTCRRGPRRRGLPAAPDACPAARRRAPAVLRRRRVAVWLFSFSFLLFFLFRCGCF